MNFSKALASIAVYRCKRSAAVKVRHQRQAAGGTVNFLDIVDSLAHSKAEVGVVAVCILALLVALKALHVVGLAVERKKKVAK